MRGPEVNKDRVGEVLIRLNIQSDGAGKIVIARHYLVAALAHEQHGRFLQEARREHLDDDVMSVLGPTQSFYDNIAAQSRP